MKRENPIREAQKAAGHIKNLYEKMLYAEYKDRVSRRELAEELMGLQKEDGSWKVIGSLRCDMDAVVDFAFEPTYYATAALIHYMRKESVFDEKVKEALKRGLEFSMRRHLAGHGYEAVSQQLKALNIYKEAGLYSWLRENRTEYPEFDRMISNIIFKYRRGLYTGRTFADWDHDFKEEFQKEVDDYDNNYDPYVWYAAYGSNINKERFMRYIMNCPDISEPLEEKKYILPYNMYFAYKSSRWGRKGVAFLDDTESGKAFGKIYKIKSSQLKYIQEAEGRIYGRKLCIEFMEGIPVYTFTSPEKRQDVNAPSKKYIDTILAGLCETYTEISPAALETYLYGCGTLDETDRKVLSCLRSSRHGMSLGNIAGAIEGGTLTKVRNSVRKLKMYELIRQDSRSVQEGHRLTDEDAVIYTRKNKRELIDILLLDIRFM